MKDITAHHLSVFPYSKTNGGNPTTIYLGNPTATQMQTLAQQNTHECGFILPSPSSSPTTLDHSHSHCHLAMRYWVPNHEMEMCGHATVGAIWLLNEMGKLPSSEVQISTKSGIVDAKVLQSVQVKVDGEKEEGGEINSNSIETRVLVSQPRGLVEELSSTEVVSEILAALGLGLDDLAVGGKVQNACTSRTKTLIPLRSWEVLDSIVPVQESVRAVCERIGSTGFYPYVIVDSGKQIVQARQFPKNSGYLEDPATGIAAAALFFGLFDGAVEGVQLGRDKSVLVRQGWSMGRPSEIEVRFRYSDASDNVIGCWISGIVRWLDTVSD